MCGPTQRRVSLIEKRRNGGVLESANIYFIIIYDI